VTFTVPPRARKQLTEEGQDRISPLLRTGQAAAARYVPDFVFGEELGESRTPHRSCIQVRSVAGSAARTASPVAARAGRWVREQVDEAERMPGRLEKDIERLTAARVEPVRREPGSPEAFIVPGLPLNLIASSHWKTRTGTGSGDRSCRSSSAYTENLSQKWRALNQAPIRGGIGGRGPDFDAREASFTGRSPFVKAARFAADAAA